MNNTVGDNDNYISQYCKWLGLYFFSLIVGALNIGVFGSLLKLFALVPILIWLCTKHSIARYKMQNQTIPFVLVCICSCAWSINTSTSIDRAITQGMFLCLIFSVSAFTYNIAEIQYLKKCLIWSSRISAILVLISADFLVGRIYLNSFVQEDPNYLCAYFLFAIVHCTTILLSQSVSGKKKVLAGLEFVLYLYIVLATGSRGGLFAILVSISIIILFYRDSCANGKYSLSARISFVLVIIIAYFVSTRFIDAEIMNRFTIQAISESNGTGRYELWEDALDAYKKSNTFRQILGYGTATVKEITYLFPFHRHNVLHNIYIENLIEIGLLGLVAYVLHITAFIKETVKTKEFYSFAIILGMVVLSLSTSLYAFKPYWNIMLFIICQSRCSETMLLDEL